MVNEPIDADGYQEVLTVVARELNANHDNSDVHTAADIAADVVRALQTQFDL